MLSVQSLTRASIPRTVKAWPEMKSRVRSLAHRATQVPSYQFVSCVSAPATAGWSSWCPVRPPSSASVSLPFLTVPDLSPLQNPLPPPPNSHGGMPQKFTCASLLFTWYVLLGQFHLQPCLLSSTRAIPKSLFSSHIFLLYLESYFKLYCLQNCIWMFQRQQIRMYKNRTYSKSSHIDTSTFWLFAHSLTPLSASCPSRKLWFYYNSPSPPISSQICSLINE